MNELCSHDCIVSDLGVMTQTMNVCVDVFMRFNDSCDLMIHVDVFIRFNDLMIHYRKQK